MGKFSTSSKLDELLRQKRFEGKHLPTSLSLLVEQYKALAAYIKIRRSFYTRGVAKTTHKSHLEQLLAGELKLQDKIQPEAIHLLYASGE